MPSRTIGVAAALLLAALPLGACGDDKSKKELSNSTAASLRSSLSEVEQRIAADDCSGASQQAATLKSEVDALPARVDGALRSALSASADRLESLIADQCAPATEAPVQEGATGTTGPDAAQPKKDENQPGNGKKDKKPKGEKPNKDEAPPDTGGAGPEGQGLNQQGGGAVPPGQE